MIDAEDREVLTLWLVRAGAGVLGILGTAVTLGLAYRIFDIVKG